MTVGFGVKTQTAVLLFRFWSFGQLGRERVEFFKASVHGMPRGSIGNSRVE